MGAACWYRCAGFIPFEVMDLEKFIRPDGSTYWAIAPAAAGDKPFVEELQPVDVSPKKKRWGLVLLGAVIAYAYL